VRPAGLISKKRLVLALVVLALVVIALSFILPRVGGGGGITPQS